MPRVDHLFVYGTLRRDFGHAMHRVISNGADPVGDAVAPGTLFDLGPYPGLWLHDSPEPGVRGEVYRLRPDQGTETLRRLDEYEGIRATEVDGCMYRREAVDVRRGADSLRAWTYVLAIVPEDAVPVPGGDYLAWVASRAASGPSGGSDSAKRPADREP